MHVPLFSIDLRDTAMLNSNRCVTFFFGPNHCDGDVFKVKGPQMVCVLHISTGKDTGIIVPYDVSDYHTWKGHEADILLKEPRRALEGMDKCYHVKWVGSPKMNPKQIVLKEVFEEKYAPNTEKIEGAKIKFRVTGGGGFSVNGSSLGHLDYVARPLWADGDKRTR